MKKNILSVFLLLLLSVSVLAQFTDDPAVNTIVNNLSGSQAVPHIAYDASGNFYVGFYSNDAGNYDIRLQYFSFDGIAQWATDGILVSGHTQNTWVTDWDLTTDNNGNCVMAFNDIRDGNANMYAYAISPTGTFLWGADGIQLSNSPEDDFEASITVTSANNTIVTWSQPGTTYNHVIMQKITPSGTLSWGTSGILYQAGSYSYSGPRVLGIDGDNFLLAFYKQTGSFPGLTRHIYVQKFDGLGNAVWADDVLASNSNGIGNYVNFYIASDNANGIIIAWNDDWDGDMNIDAKAQRVLADGSIPWPANGVEMNTTASTSNQNTRIVGLTSNDEVILVWDKKNANQSQTAIAGQKISNTGSRQWTDNGIDFIPTSADISGAYGGDVFNGTNSLIVYEESTGGTTGDIKAIGVDGTGSLLWSPTITTMSSRATAKSHDCITGFYNNQLIVAWEDGSPADLLMQNIFTDGSIGDPPISSDATLSDLTVNSVTVDGFSPDIYYYEVPIPTGDPLPITGATAADPMAIVNITQAVAVPGQSSVLVTAEDGTTQLTYTIDFYIAGNDATLSDLTVDGTTIPGFAPDVFSYDYSVATGDPIPVVGATLADPLATMTINQATALPGAATVVVISEDGLTTNTYTVNFLYTPGDDASLADLLVAGTTISGFAPDIYYYEYACVYNSPAPYTDGIPNDPLATVDDTQCLSIPGDAVLIVTAEDGVTQLTYTVHFFYMGYDATLSDLTVDGTTIPGFDPEVTSYQYVVPDTINIPVVDGTPTDPLATVNSTQATEIPGEAYLTVIAEDGVNEQTYTVYFYTLAADATLSDLTVDGVTIEGFDPAVYHYEVYFEANSILPIIDGTTTDPLATKVITQVEEIPGEGTIVVTAQDGISQLTYTVGFNFIIGIDETDGEKIALFPIPFNNYLNVINVSIKSNIKIINLVGKEVYNSPFTGDPINLSFLEQGVYFAVIEKDGEVLATKKVVKR